MKKFIVVMCSFALLTQLPVPAQAHDPVVKLSRGIVNVLTSPIEYIGQTAQLREENNRMVSFFGGIIRGTFFTAVRIVGGVYEIVTFPIPIPRHYAPVFDPETGLEIIDELNGKKSYAHLPTHDPVVYESEAF